MKDPTARVITFEYNPANAAIAKQIHEWAGATDRVCITCYVCLCYLFDSHIINIIKQ